MLIFGENYVTAMIALLDSVENVLGIILAMAASMNVTYLSPRRRLWARLLRVVRMRWMIRTLGRDDLDIPRIEGCREHYRCLQQSAS